MKRTLVQRTIAKTSWKLLPLIVGIYFVAYVERTNISVAALGMNKTLGFSDYLYGWGAGIFFLELPSRHSPLPEKSGRAECRDHLL